MSGIDRYTKVCLHFGSNLVQDECKTKSDNETNNIWMLCPEVSGTPNSFSVSKGSPSLSTTNKKFGPSSLYIPSVSGVKRNSSLPFGTSDFSVDFWFFISGWNSNNTMVAIGDNKSGYLQFVVSKTGVQAGPVSGTQKTLNSPIELASWYHIAYVRKNNKSWLFLNGTKSSQFDDDFNYKGLGHWIGYNGSSNENAFNGYIDELRVSNVSRWNNDFKPPIAAYTVDQYTKMLLHFDGQSIVDEMPVETPPVRSTNGSAFSGGVFFDGSGYMWLDGTLVLGKKDFTIDCWINVVGAPPNHSRAVIWDLYRSAKSEWEHLSLFFEIDSSMLKVSISGYSTGVVIKRNHLYHTAVTYSNTEHIFRLYLDGKCVASMPYTMWQVTFLNVRLGCNGYFGYNVELPSLIGTISEFRISDGILRWTKDFEVPTVPYDEAPDNTWDTSKTKLYVKESMFNTKEKPLFQEELKGYTSIRKLNPFIVSAKDVVYFRVASGALIDSTGNNWTVHGSFSLFSSPEAYKFVSLNSSWMDTSTSFVLGDADFSIDFFAMIPSRIPYNACLLGIHGSDTDATRGRISVMNKENNSTGGFLNVRVNSSSGGNLDSIKTKINGTNILFHYAIVYTQSDKKWKIYINGVLESATILNMPAKTFNHIILGKNLFATSKSFVGYIGFLRISPGLVRWKENFSPPFELLL